MPIWVYLVMNLGFIAVCVLIVAFSDGHEDNDPT